MGQYYRQIAGIPMAFSVGLTMELLKFRFPGPTDATVFDNRTLRDVREW
jgi:hypothetical protein